MYNTPPHADDSPTATVRYNTQMTLTRAAQRVLASGGAVLTANARASRHLHRVNHLGELEAGNSAWRSPQILPLAVWLDESWHTLIIQGAEDRLLLSPLAAEEVWVRVLEEDGAGARVLTVRGLARTASEAWRLLWAYGDLNHLRNSSAYGDTRAFAGWAERFLRLAERNRWMDTARLSDAITKAVSEGTLSLPPEILFCGFDRVAPVMQRLVEALRSRGCQSEFADYASASDDLLPFPLPASRESTLVEAETPTEEWRTIATWTRDAIAANSSIHINIVVPDVGAVRDVAEHAFRRVLAPESRGILTRDAVLPYEFSLGMPLSQYSLIRAALLILRWALEEIPLDDISWLLNCQYWGDDDEWSRARADAELRRRGKSLRLQADMHWTINALNRAGSLCRDKLIDLQRTATQLRLNQKASRAGYTSWMEASEKYLAGAGWPGSTPLNSDEYQSQQRWQRVLLAVAHLDASLPKVSFREAFQILTRAAQSSLFAPESLDAPVQIVGANESAGLSADAVWFADSDDLSWPAAAQPNPLLPLHLQRSLKIPHSEIAADFEFSSAVTRRICYSAPIVFASFARQKDDAELSESPVVSAARWSKRIRALEMHQHHPEQCVVETMPLLDRSHVPWQEMRSAGGAQILKDQAACPFRAFASKRLRAQTLEEIEEGLGRRDRGNVVHKAMDGFWNEVTNQQHLLLLTEPQSLEILHRHITSALEEHAAPDPWSKAFLDAESNRLMKLLSGWLQLERQRSPFSVAEREQGREAMVGPLKLSLRIDRLDDTAGGKIILDYKTGKTSTRDWEGDRPDQPQLPLYALNIDPLGGLAFGCIGAKKTGITGWQDKEGVFFPEGDERGKKMTHAFAEKVADWRAVLGNLAQEFASGEARVLPKNGSITCRNCGLETLCRVAETQLVASGEEVDE